MGDWPRALFALVCGQDVSHTWTTGGALLPLCQRCTGLYAGAATGLFLHLALRIKPGNRFLWVHGVFLLAMVPFGFHWLPQGEVVRALSGFVFGLGLVSFLWLIPGPSVVPLRPIAARSAFIYIVAAGAGAVTIPVLGTGGGSAARIVLITLASIGLFGLAALAGAALAVGGGRALGSAAASSPGDRR
jgi:uncharacterized membrane protein